MTEVHAAIGQAAGRDFHVGRERERERCAFQHELFDGAAVDAIHEQRAIARGDEFIAATPGQVRECGAVSGELLCQLAVRVEQRHVLGLRKGQLLAIGAPC